VLVLPYGSVTTFSQSFLLESNQTESEIDETLLKRKEMIKMPEECKFLSNKTTEENFHLSRKIIDNIKPAWTRLFAKIQQELINEKRKLAYSRASTWWLVRNKIISRNADGSFKSKCDKETGNLSLNFEERIIDTALALNEIVQLTRNFEDEYLIICFSFGPSSEAKGFVDFDKYYKDSVGFNASRFFEDAIETGVRFLNTSFHSNYKNGTSDVDNLILSVLALWFSNLELKEDANKILTTLEAKSSRNEEGLFWSSKWNEMESCQGSLSDYNKPSLITTAFALSAYVKVKKDGAEKIAKWLLSKYSREEFKSLVEAEEVAKALDSFADNYELGNGKRPSILTRTIEYVCPLENAAGDDDDTNFALKVIPSCFQSKRIE